MRKKVIYLSAILFIVTNIEVCRAQATLSLREAVEKALQSRASLKAEAERVTAAEGLEKQAKLLPNPSFEFQNENLRPGQTYTHDVDTLAMISTPLDVLGKRKQRVALAAEGVNAPRRNMNLARWQVSRESSSPTGRRADRRRFWKFSNRRTTIFRKSSITIRPSSAREPSRNRIFCVSVWKASACKSRASWRSSRPGAPGRNSCGKWGRPVHHSFNADGTAGATEGITPLSVDQVVRSRAEIKVARAAVEQAKANVRLQEVSARPDMNLLAGYKRTELPDARTA